MAIPQAKTSEALRITRIFPAPAEQVFRAWTNPEALSMWFAPSDQFRTTVPELDLKVGGRYRIEMRIEDQVHIVEGTYREIRPPERLVFTWRWVGEAGEMLVTVEFRARGPATEVVLIHEQFSDQESREKHAHGWAGCLNGLQKFLS